MIMMTPARITKLVDSYPASSKIDEVSPFSYVSVLKETVSWKPNISTIDPVSICCVASSWRIASITVFALVGMVSWKSAVRTRICSELIRFHRYLRSSEKKMLMTKLPAKKPTITFYAS